MKIRAPRVVLLTLIAAFSLSACSDEVCPRGQHPVRWIEDHDGSICVEDGQPAPPGYEEYPAGATPTEA